MRARLPYARSGRRPPTIWTERRSHGTPDARAFTICPKRLARSEYGNGPPRVPESYARTPTGAADEMRVGLRRAAYGERDANAFRELLKATISLKAKEIRPRRGEEVRCSAFLRSCGQLVASP